MGEEELQTRCCWWSERNFTKRLKFIQWPPATSTTRNGDIATSWVFSLVSLVALDYLAMWFRGFHLLNKRNGALILSISDSSIKNSQSLPPRCVSSSGLLVYLWSPTLLLWVFCVIINYHIVQIISVVVVVSENDRYAEDEPRYIQLPGHDGLYRDDDRTGGGEEKGRGVLGRVLISFKLAIICLCYIFTNHSVILEREWMLFKSQWHVLRYSPLSSPKSSYYNRFFVPLSSHTILSSWP